MPRNAPLLAAPPPARPPSQRRRDGARRHGGIPRLSRPARTGSRYSGRTGRPGARDWRNLLVSFVHSVVAGAWAVVGVWIMPEMFADLVHTTPSSGHLLLCFSGGKGGCPELKSHVNAVSGLCSGIFRNRFVAAGLVLLLVEVSNIFLTVRMLLRLGNLPFHTLYRINKYLNVTFYFVFRVAPQAYLTWYFFRFVEMEGQGAYLMVHLVLLDAMIMSYCLRLLRSDFCVNSQRRDPGEEKFLMD
uniref:TLC domain containing 1 n=1 Tax=Varanus komodoensis TaxID=61221 RepID=A0A8D2IVL7_VARKO